jgi:hypothetical protein
MIARLVAFRLGNEYFNAPILFSHLHPPLLLLCGFTRRTRGWLELDCAAANKLDELIEDRILAEEGRCAVELVGLLPVMANCFLGLFAH